MTARQEWLFSCRILGPTRFTIQVPSGWTDSIQTSNIIADRGRPGINVTVQSPQYGTYTSDQTNGTFTGVLAGEGGQPDPYWSFYYLLNPTNTFGFKSATANSLLANWNATTNRSAQQHRHAHALEHLMMNQLSVRFWVYGGSLRYSLLPEGSVRAVRFLHQATYPT